MPESIGTPDHRVAAVVTLTRPDRRLETVVEVRLSIRTPAGRDERAGASWVLITLARLMHRLAKELT